MASGRRATYRRRERGGAKARAAMPKWRSLRQRKARHTIGGMSNNHMHRSAGSQPLIIVQCRRPRPVMWSVGRRVRNERRAQLSRQMNDLGVAIPLEHDLLLSPSPCATARITTSTTPIIASATTSYRTATGQGKRSQRRGLARAQARRRTAAKPTCGGKHCVACRRKADCWTG